MTNKQVIYFDFDCTLTMFHWYYLNVESEVSNDYLESFLIKHQDYLKKNIQLRNEILFLDKKSRIPLTKLQGIFEDFNYNPSNDLVNFLFNGELKNDRLNKIID